MEFGIYLRTLKSRRMGDFEYILSVLLDPHTVEQSTIFLYYGRDHGRTNFKDSDI
jgi:hypothetical protein